MHADAFRTLPLVWSWPQSVCSLFSAGISLLGTLLMFLGCQKTTSSKMVDRILGGSFNVLLNQELGRNGFYKTRSLKCSDGFEVRYFQLISTLCTFGVYVHRKDSIKKFHGRD
ncbi:hypothetical protein NC653_020050 [Populus alba x Populus x berolinensis]|uniref:Uncharacterized protein n=1 Tax=Populus alba x Populus x berolinensis TaxID=444605 RepID=A0AAD6MJE0_9ROSI|nr:hypothetical protein NC653_020045 [Populus alba x Populus x berolinensis]KAJ6986702.1 hypothetical protein NC653_020050 [Populus alba x Populus x berolinensis]